MGEERHNLRIEGWDARMSGTARVGTRRRLRVPGALPGEHVRLRVLKRGKGGRPDLTRLEQVWEAHDERVTPFCPRHEARAVIHGCTGCGLQHASWSLQRALKLDWLRTHMGLDVASVEHDEADQGYRWVSKRVVQRRDGRLVLGSYVKGSHAVASMEGCRVDHPAIRRAADELLSEAQRLGVAAFDPSTGEGDLRYAWFKTNGEEVLTTLVTGRACEAVTRELASRLTASHGVAWCVQSGEGNDMRGEGVQQLTGLATIQLPPSLGGQRHGPLGFMQPNPVVAAMARAALLCDVDEAPLRGVLAWDLYAGSGATTEALREHFEEVVGCERHVEPGGAEGIVSKEVSDFLSARADTERVPGLVVANPPRGGMGGAVVAQLRAIGPEHLHIMSCNPRSLRRDLEGLVEDGRFQLVSVRAFDTLPHTEHVELVARLVRAATDSPPGEASTE